MNAPLYTRWPAGFTPPTVRLLEADDDRTPAHGIWRIK